MNVQIRRLEDPEEVEGFPKKMNDCFKSSDTVWIGMIDDEIACLWGICLPTLLSDRVYLWLWTSDVVKDHPFVLVRRAQIVVKELLKEHRAVIGVVNLKDSGAARSIRWLKLLGARFSEPERDVLPFEIRRV